jgi:hypothetical protein
MKLTIKSELNPETPVNLPIGQTSDIADEIMDVFRKHNLAIDQAKRVIYGVLESFEQIKI